MSVVIVRHGVAVEKRSWTGDDALRPLTPRGCGQAAALAGWLDAPVGRVLSSPTLRCLATVLPLSRTRGVDLATDAGLLPGVPARTVELVTALLAAHGVAGAPAAVVCSHGEVIPPLLRALGLASSTHDLDATRKGSAWTLDVAADGARHATYHQLDPADLA